MALEAGTRLGPYEIVAALGAGGMGEVYRARDTRLERTVAIKVLNSAVAATPELKQRFEREARTISQLNHPHICTLYDVGHQDGTDFLVMEYLEGETLAQRLSKGALPLPELVKIAVEALSGLEQAHRAGIVHRDLKPGNVMLTKGGAKLLDFGLAKPVAASAAAGSHPSNTGQGGAPMLSAAMTSPSPQSPLTTTGTLVGTVQYMAPEQLEGKEADARTDIFAFGAMLYEMAAGKRPFDGKSQLKIASAILEDEPPSLTQTNAALPAKLEHVVRSCLRKVPDDRYQSAHDIAVELRWIAESRTASSTKSSRANVGSAWLAVLVIIGVVLGGAAAYFLAPKPASPQIALAVLPTPGLALNFSGLFGPPAVSPDGTRIAMTATDSTGERVLLLRSLGNTTAQVIQGTNGASYPFWSPDGQKIGFFTGDTLKVADLAAGSVLILTSVAEGRGGTWNGHGDIVYGTRATGLFRVPESGGSPVQVTKLSGQESSHRFPTFFPDGEHLAYVVQTAGVGRVDVIALSRPTPTPLDGVISNVAFSRGRLFHVRDDGTLLAQRFDVKKLSLDHNAQVVAKPVGYDGQFNYAAFGVSPQGAVAYEEGSGSTANELVVLDRQGKQKGSLPVLVSGYSGIGLRISPRSDRLLYSVSGAKRSDVWVMPLGRDSGTGTRISLGPEGGDNAVWSPDARLVAYQNVIGGGKIIVRTSDGGGSERTVVNAPGEALPAGWSADGKYVLFEFVNHAVGGISREIWVAAIDGNEPPHALVRDINPWSANLSPDGKWLAYTSSDSGRQEVYVIPFDPHATLANALAAGRWQVSAEGGAQPRWSPSGKELVFANTSLTTFYAAKVEASGGKFERGEITRLFDLPPHPAWAFYDVARDGSIYMFRFIGRQAAPLTVLLNWRPAEK